VNVDNLLEEVRQKLKVQKVILITVDPNGVGVGTLGFTNPCEALGSFEAGKQAYYNATERPVIQPPHNTIKDIQ
jgi:hypothetical protein